MRLLPADRPYHCVPILYDVPNFPGRQPIVSLIVALTCILLCLTAMAGEAGGRIAVGLTKIVTENAVYNIMYTVDTQFRNNSFNMSQ